MRALPNLEVIVPADPVETKIVTKFLASTKSPSYLRLGKSNEEKFNHSEVVISPGRFNELISGESGTILFAGSIGKIALKAARELVKLGYSVSVTSVPFLTSLDKDYLISASFKGPIITIEEHSIRGGFGSAILEFFNVEHISATVGIVAAEQRELSQIGDQEFLRGQNSLHEEKIIEKFKALKEA
jgi:transketolase